MAAISYQIAVGQQLASVTVGTAAPTSGAGFIELRMDQSNVVNDASYAGGLRAQRKGEIQQLIRILEMYLIGDTSVFP